MAGHLHQPSEIADPEWVEFEGLLSEMARIAKSGLPFDRLARSLLERTVHLLAAVGGAVWLGTRAAPMRMQCQLNYDELASAYAQGDHQQLLDQSREIGEIVVVPPGGDMVGSRTLANPTDLTLLIAPLKVDQDVVGLFEIIQRSSTSAAAIQGNRRLLGLVCELAADQLRLQELRELRDEQLRTQQFEDLLARVHGSLDLRTVAYELVNSARQFIGCDRVSVAIRKGKGFQLIAISSVDAINRRSNAVRRLEELAARIAAANETVWYDGQGEESLAPQILESLRRFADDAHPQIVGLMPLKMPPCNADEARQPPLGVLIVEQFDSELDSTARARAERAATHSAAALANALQYELLPTLPFAKRRRPLGKPAVGMFTKMALLSTVIAVAALFSVPADFKVHAEGELQPREQRHLFAPLDGQVSSLRVKHGDNVKAEDVLLELRSPDVELQRQRIQGEFDTTQQRIAAIESSLLQEDEADEADISRFNQLAAEQEELTQLLASQREQLALLREEREKLVIASPMNGQVLTFDLEQSLTDRPVQRGQLLVTVANLQGPWMAELEVPDDEIGHVLAAQTQDAPPLSASFQLATNRGVDYQGEVSRISSRTETSKDDRPVVRVALEVDEQAIGDLRPGATIFADIHCGRRSWAYVLFHDLVETVQGWFNF